MYDVHARQIARKFNSGASANPESPGTVAYQLKMQSTGLKTATAKDDTIRSHHGKKGLGKGASAAIQG